MSQHRFQPPHHNPYQGHTSQRSADGRATVATVLTSILLGVILGAGGVFFFVPDRAANGSETPAAVVNAARDALPGDPPAEPKTKGAVQAAAQEELGRYAAGDYGGAWDLWHSKGKQAFSRDDYVRLHQLCPPVAEGLKFTIDAVNYQAGAEQAKVRVSRLVATFTYTMLYENGRWTYMPTDQNLVDYRKGPDALAAEKRAQGGCAEAG